MATSAPLLLLTAVIGYQNLVHREREAGQGLTTGAQRAARHIEDYLDAHIASVEAFAAAYPRLGSEPAVLTEVLRKHHGVFDGFLTMLVADRRGMVVATSPEAFAKRSLSVADRGYFLRPMATGHHYISEAFQGRAYGSDPIIAVSAPLRDSNGRIQGIVEGSLNLARFSRFAAHAATDEQQILVVDQYDRVIFPGSHTNFRFLQTLAGSPLINAAASVQGSTFRIPGEMMGACVRTTNKWRVITMQPIDGIRRETFGIVLSLFFWLFLGICIAVVLARITASRVTRPLERVLARVRQLAAGDAPDSDADQITDTPVELQELMTSFDAMSGKLTNSYDEIRIAKTDLEHRVQDRTMELAEANRSLQAEIADKVRAQETLLLRDRAMAAAAEGVAITDYTAPNNPLIYVNSGFERITGYSAVEVLGKNCRLLQGPETDPATIDRLRTAIREGRDCTVELLNYRKDGATFWNRLSITPVLNDRGVITHFVGIQSDVTHQKEIERLKADLVSTVSHELRTPLSSLRGFIELLLTREYPRERQRHFLQILDREVTRLTDLINRFLDLQRMEAGREVYHKAPTDVCAIMDEVVTLFDGTHRTHHLRTAIDRTLPHLNIDAERFRQVLSNLISNAIKFSPDGGEVVVTARMHAGEAMFEVHDQGLGIPPEALPKLFTRFFRVDNTETRRIGGTGLGLELVKRIVEAHDGRVWVDSECRRGSTFGFALPCPAVRAPVETVPEFVTQWTIP